MYLGEIVEIGEVSEIFEPPHHPYTEILLSSIPRPTVEPSEKRIIPEGEPPSPIDPPEGCRFQTRCPYAMPECAEKDPEHHDVDPGHQIDCHLYDLSFMESKSVDLEEKNSEHSV